MKALSAGISNTEAQKRHTSDDAAELQDGEKEEKRVPSLDNQMV